MTTVELARDRTLSVRRAFFGPLTRLLNPAIRRMAGRRGVPLMGLVYHRGRRSGRTYMVPVLIASTGPLLWITLTFGSTSDWCRNVLEAGGCRVKLRGVEYYAHKPQVVDDLTAADEVNAAFAPFLRILLRAMGIHQFLRLRIQTEA